MQIEAAQGDIVREQVDAIVNAANNTLLGGGGVDGAIHRAAGPKLLEDCRRIRKSLPDGLPVGDAVTTGGYDLSARWVIHTVGPNRNRGQTDPELLASCFRASLDEALRVDARSIAFPAISGGAYGWDMADVARIAVATVREWEQGQDAGLDLVRFVLFSADALAAFEKELA